MGAATGWWALTFCAETTYGQGLRTSNVATNTTNSVTNIGQVGNTAVSQRFGQGLATGSISRTLPPRQNARELSRSGTGMSLFARRAGARRNLVGSAYDSPISLAVTTNWHKRIAAGGAGRYLRTPPVYRAGPGMQQDATVANVVLDPRSLLSTTSFFGPAHGLGLPTGGMRDAQALREATDVAPYTSFTMRPPSSRKERPTQSEMMFSQLADKRHRILKEAWGWFRSKDYGRAREAFRSAEMLDRSDPEPRAGQLFCSVAEGRYAQAIENFNRILARDMAMESDPLDHDFNLAARYETVRQMRQDTSKLLEYQGEHKKDLRLYGAVCYFLWQTGSHREAAQGAQNMIQADPTGPAGRFGKLVAEAAKRKRAAPAE